MASDSNIDIAFIGIGTMGLSMAGHLLAAGHRMHVFNRTRAKADPLVGRGATWHDTPGAAAAAADVVFTIVGTPEDVESVYFGPIGIIENARDRALLIDMTTSSPALARRIADAAEKRGLSVLDAPVSGGDIGAREARLVIMAGGSEKAYTNALPLLKKLGRNIRRFGGPGTGQHAKLANQIVVAGGMMGMCEALAYADTAGLDLTALLDSIGGGAAGSWALSNLAPRILKDDFGPGFYVKHFIKDLRLALESAAELGLEMPAVALARKLYEALAAQGHETSGTQALYRLYQSRRGQD